MCPTHCASSARTRGSSPGARRKCWRGIRQPPLAGAALDFRAFQSRQSNSSQTLSLGVQIRAPVVCHRPGPFGFAIEVGERRRHHTATAGHPSHCTAPPLNPRQARGALGGTCCSPRQGENGRKVFRASRLRREHPTFADASACRELQACAGGRASERDAPQL